MAPMSASVRLPRARVVLGALVGAGLAIALAGRIHAPVGPFDTTVVARPSLHGISTVRLAPLGSIELDTHRSPVSIELRVDELRQEEAERIARNPAVLERLEDDIAGDAEAALLELLLRVLVVGTIGGVAGALVVRRAWRVAVGGAAVGAVVTGLLIGITAATFEPEAVAEPRYSGLIAVAPSAVGDVEAIVERFDDYRAQLTDLVGNVVTLYETAQGLPDLDPGDNTVRVLHVSDIHNNPQAYDLIDQLVRQFGVDAVFDTGDTTDWGSDSESRLVERIGDVGVPYVWVRGNHDSRRVQAAVAAQEGAVVLDGSAREVAGIRVWGIGDPRYTPNKDQPTGQDVERDQAEAFAAEVDKRLSRAGAVDVVLVHDRRMATEIGDDVPLVLAGHTHQPRQAELGDAILLTEGSTGGAGLRGLQGEEPEPLTASILYFDPDTDRLVAYDRITVRGIGTAGVRIERHVIDAREPDEP